MKKKSLLIVAILTFVLSFAFAACGETETPHTHEYTAYEWVEGSTPTETEAGKATATCSTCGESTTVDVPKLTDESVWTVTTTDATCTEDGEKTYTSKYGTVKVAIAASHKFGDLVAAKAATCETAGNVAYYHCTVCEKNFAEDGTTELADVTTPAKGHNYGDLIAAVAATCTQEGNIAYYHCVDCNKYFNADKEELDGVEDTVIAKLPHAYGEWQPDGAVNHKRVCENDDCDAYETAAHDYTGAAYTSVDETKHSHDCVVCGYTAEEEHTFGAWTFKDSTHHAKTCVCGEEVTANHNFVNGVCEDCHTSNPVANTSYARVTVNSGSTSAYSDVFTFDAEGTADGSVFKKNGITYDYDDVPEYQYSNSKVSVVYVDVTTGKVNVIVEYDQQENTAYSWQSPKWSEITHESQTYVGYIDKANGFIFMRGATGENGSLYSSFLLVPTDATPTADQLNCKQIPNFYGTYFLTYEKGDSKYSVFVSATDNTIAPHATVTDFDNATVAPDDFATAPAMIVKDKDGKVIGRYGYDGSKGVELDDWAGKYTGNLGAVTVWGYGKITTELGDGTYTAVVADDHNIEVTYYNSDNEITAYYEITANNTAYTYTGVAPEVTVTYDLDGKGSNTTANRVKNVVFTLPAAPVSTDGNYVFLHWVDGDENVYAAGAKVSVTAATTFTAVWDEAVEVVIVDNVNTANNKTVTAGSTENLKEVIEANTNTVVEGEEFKYWTIVDSDGQVVEIDASWEVGSSAITVTAVYKTKYTLTLVYGNGLDNVTETYFEGAATSPKEPPYTDGKTFDYWYTSDDEGVTEKAKYVAGTAIESNTTIYAAWVEANILYGKYKGFEVYGSSFDSPSFVADKTAEIDKTGKATSGSRINGNTVADYENGFFHFGNYYGYYDEVSKILVYNDSTGTGDQNDVHILFKNVDTATSAKASYLRISNTQKLIDVTVTRGSITESFTIYFSAKKVQKVTWKAAEDFTAVSELFTLKTSSGWSSTAGKLLFTTLKVYDLDGNLIGDFVKDGTNIVELDGSQGTYTLDGGEDLVLTGTGKATIGTDEGTVTKAVDGSEYDYDLYITQGGVKVYYELTIDKEAKTYSVYKPMVTLSFDLDGKGTIDSVSVNKNIEFSLSTDEYKPSYEGYNFKGWYTSKTVGEDGTVTWGSSVYRVTPTADTTVYAKWAQIFNVTFETEYGDAPESLVIENEEWVGTYYMTKLTDTDDYAFYGWYIKGDETQKLITSSVQVKSDMTFVALWKAKVTLTVKYENGVANKTEKIAPEKSFDVSKYNPTADELGDYVFRYFYLESDESKTKITSVKPNVGEDVTIVAKMEHTVTLTVKYDGNHAEDVTVVIGPNDTIDFTTVNAKTYTDENGQLMVPDKYYTDAALTTEFTGTSIAANTTIYVSWQEAHALYGEYKGANYDPNESKDVAMSNGSHTQAFKIDANGKVLSGSTRVPEGNVAKLNDDGTLSFTGSSTYNGGYDAKYGIFYYDFQTGKTDPYHDIYVMFKTVGNVSVTSSVGSAWDKGCTKLFTATYSDSTTLNVFIYNRRIYGGVTFVAKDKDGALITDVNKVYEAQTVYVLNDEGDLIAGFSKQNGSLAVDVTVVPEA